MTKAAMSLKIKRGDSFVLSCEATAENGQPMDLALYVIRAEVRRSAGGLGGDPGALVAALDFTAVTPALGRFELAAPGDTTTATWPLGELLLDIVYETPGAGVARRVVSTETVVFVCLPRVTQA